MTKKIETSQIEKVQKQKKKRRKNGIDCSEHVTKKIDIGEIIGEINIKSNKKMKEINDNCGKK